MNQIPVPVIFFAAFIILAVILNYLQNKTTIKYHQKIKDWLTQNSIEFDSTIFLKVKTSMIGRKMNEGFGMAKCEILVTNDALIILGKTLLNINSNPIIFTRNFDYAMRFPFAKVVTPNKINLHSFSNSIYFEFGKASFSDYCFMIRIYNVENKIKDKIESVLNENSR